MGTRQRIRALLVAGGLLCGLAPLGCATGSPRHQLTVTVGTAHATLAAVQDVEMALVCGRSSAPPEPNCIPEDKHRALSAMLVTAFELDGRAARIVRALPDGATQPAELGTIIAQLQGIVATVMDALPKSKPKAELVKTLEGALMPMMLAAIQWLTLGQKVFAAGSGLWMQIKGLLAQHGIEADTSALDDIIADADIRKARAEQEARGHGP